MSRGVGACTPCTPRKEPIPYLAKQILIRELRDFDWSDSKPTVWPRISVPWVPGFVFNRDGVRYHLSLVNVNGEVMEPGDYCSEDPDKIVIKRELKKEDYLFVRKLLLSELTDGFHVKEFKKALPQLDQKFGVKPSELN